MEPVTYVRGARLIDIRLTKEFIKDYDATHQVIDRLFSFVRDELRSGRLVALKRHGMSTDLIVAESTWIPDKPVKNDDGTKSKGCFSDTYTHAQYKNNVIPPELWEIEGCEIIKCPESMKRNLFQYVVERFLSYKQRNKKKEWSKIQPTNARKRVLYYKDNFVKIDKTKKTITFPTLYGSHTLRYGFDHLFEHVDDTKKWSGNFNRKQKIFVVVVKIPFKPLYIPNKNNVLSFDCNKSAGSWIVLNNGVTIEMPEEIESKTKQLRELNKIIADKRLPVSERKYRSRDRSKQRKGGSNSIQGLHAQIDKLVEPAVDKMIEEAIKGEKLLSIDGVKTGQHNGSFGQDHLIPMLQTKCEVMGVPFYVTPAAYTSQRCSDCGKVDKANRPTTEEFMCVGCGHVANAHDNAALNIANSASTMYSGGDIKIPVPYGNYSGKRGGLDQVMKEHSRKYQGV